MRTLGAALLACVLACGPLPATAGEKPKGTPTPAPSAQKPVLPDADKIVLLVRTTLLTVNDAIHTGNYTVLRDKAAPSFRDSTTPTTLGLSLDSLAKQRIDLSAVAVVAPQLSAVPVIDAQQRLRLKGYFPGQPIGIGFDLSFEVVGGGWRLSGLSISLVKTPAASANAVKPAKESVKR